MAYAIHIEKIKESHGIHYYFVSENNPLKPEFYIGIDSKAKIVYFFDSFECLEAVGIIDFNKSTEIFSIKNLPERATFNAAMQAYKALLKNNFPNNIGRYS